MKRIAVLAALAIAAPLAAEPVATTATAPSTAPKFTTDTPIETIAADPAGKAALDSVMPGLTAHPMYDQFKAMSLKALQPMSGGKITDEGLAKMDAALAAIK